MKFGSSEKIKDVSVNYEGALYDHFPVNCILDLHVATSCNDDFKNIVNEFINWMSVTFYNVVCITW